MRASFTSTIVHILAAITTLAGCSDGSSDGPSHGPRFTGPGWYRHATFYQIWVRSFYDSDGDGIGDLRGITEKLDYIASLGVGAIWLTPFYPTPYFDSGYDVADYRAVDPDCGTLEDFDELLTAAHARGLRVFCELVLNHTSIEHAWLVESRSALDSPKRDWYLWAAEPNIPCRPSDPVFSEDGWTLDETTGEEY